MSRVTCVEICAGAGGQALGLERAGFAHVSLVEFDKDACSTLRLNRPDWDVIEADVRTVKGTDLSSSPNGLDLLAGGIPCPPFSVAGKGLGKDDDRDLFPEVLRLLEELQPRALMIENVKGLMSSRFSSYRREIEFELNARGFEVAVWDVFEACQFGVPQRRPRSILVAFASGLSTGFLPPEPTEPAPTVGDTLLPLLGDWNDRHQWAAGAQEIAPTLVGGSRRHGGADLGPTGAKRAWARLGVNGHLIANELPPRAHSGPITLTVEHAAALQSFPEDWVFVGGKTSRYRQVGNAFPPPVAEAFGRALLSVLSFERR
jgi:DNA (cytosine-5)-methyltransferase 1